MTQLCVLVRSLVRVSLPRLILLTHFPPIDGMMGDKFITIITILTSSQEKLSSSKISDTRYYYHPRKPYRTSSRSYDAMMNNEWTKAGYALRHLMTRFAASAIETPTTNQTNHACASCVKEMVVTDIM